MYIPMIYIDTYSVKILSSSDNWLLKVNCIDFKSISRAVTHTLMMPVLMKHDVHQQFIVIYIYFRYH